MKIFTLLIGLLLLLPSCSTPEYNERYSEMQKEDCQNLDWQQLGQIESSKGLSQEMLDYHIRRCPPEIESAARSLYLKGYQEGIANYCTYRIGFIKGEVGDPIPTICENPNYTEFYKGYREGLRASHK